MVFWGNYKLKMRNLLQDIFNSIYNHSKISNLLGSNLSYEHENNSQASRNQSSSLSILN